jgi:hypothetical protein
VRFAQTYGAEGCVVVNDAPGLDRMPRGGLFAADIAVPAVMVGMHAGHRLK